MGDIAVTLMGISPICFGLIGKKMVFPSSLGIQTVCWFPMAFISLEITKISKLSLVSRVTVTYKTEAVS